MGSKKLDRAGLIAAAQEFAKTREGRITYEPFVRETGISNATVYRYFDSFAEMLTAAGLSDRVARLRRVSRLTLLREFHRVAELVGHEPTRAELSEHARIRARVFNRYLGSWSEVRLAYARWKAGGGAGREDAAASELPALDAEMDGAEMDGAGVDGAVPGDAAAGGVDGGGARLLPPGERAPGERVGWSSARLLGEPLGFRGVLHAPVNEMGVVHLFGVLHDHHGIAVDYMGAAFPDCQGVREERPRGVSRWRRVRIEFEYRSSNFRAHGHDVGACDLIVCWEHDWEECPIEVLELKDLLVRARAA